jgi:hypothetical protein
MTRALILALALAAPAQAQTVAVWGNGGHVEITAGSGGAHVATVTLHNRRNVSAPHIAQIGLTLYGLPVEVLVTHRPDPLPDVLEVIPPPGPIAVPPRLAVQENEAGSVMLFRIDMMEVG